MPLTSATFTSLLAALAVSTAALAQGPGTRIRSGSSFDSFARPPATASDLEQRCQKTRGAEHDRCMREVRRRDEAEDTTSKPTGPGATGMSSGSATGTASGSAGGAASGMTSPR